MTNNKLFNLENFYFSKSDVEIISNNEKFRKKYCNSEVFIFDKTISAGNIYQYFNIDDIVLEYDILFMMAKCAIAYDNLSIFSYFVQLGSIDLAIYNQLFLKIAIYNYSIKIAEYLLINGLNVTNDSVLLINLYFTGYGCSTNLMRLLIDYGIDINIKNNLILRKFLTRDDTAFVKYLLDSGASINDAINSLDKKSIANIPIDTLKLLYEYGVNFTNISNDTIESLILYAHANKIKLLYEYGVDFTIINNYQRKSINDDNYKFTNDNKIKMLMELGVDPIVIVTIIEDEYIINTRD